MTETNNADKRVVRDEFVEGYEFEDKRRLRVTLSYINEDGTLEEVTNNECSGAFVFAFDGWDKDKGVHDVCCKTGVKVSELDLAGAILADEELEGVNEIINAALVEKKLKELVERVIHGKP